MVPYSYGSPKRFCVMFVNLHFYILYTFVILKLPGPNNKELYNVKLTYHNLKISNMLSHESISGCFWVVTHIHTDRQTDRQTDRETDRQTDRQTDTRKDRRKKKF